MGGTHSNNNLLLVARCQFIDYSDTAESATLADGTIAVSIYSTSDCWVVINLPGTVQAAAIPAAEKTAVANQLFLPSGVVLDYPVSPRDSGGKATISVIRDSEDGRLHITERKV